MGSGKSVLAEFLSKKFNAEIIDADKIARKIMTENNDLIAEIGKNFGVVENGKIDFAKLGKIVFENTENLQKLNETTFPYIIPAINSEFRIPNSELILDAPLLSLISPKEICDFAIWIDCPTETRIERLTERTKLSKEVVRNRVEKQMEIMPAPKADDFWCFVENNSQQNTLFEKAEKLISSRLT
jgi:dephospho-CoA kinase